MGHLSFQLDSSFVATYEGRPVPWGFGVLSEVVFLDKYSRVKPDGTKERWHEVCERVINGMYSIQKDHCGTTRVPWYEEQAQSSAQEAYERLFTFKWTPPGRGLWMMGTEFVHANRNSAALQNCSFVSTDDLFKSMAFLMEASMLGVGVGFDTGAEGSYTIHTPDTRVSAWEIPDTREGWVDSTTILLRSFLEPGMPTMEFDYKLIRPKGDPIKGFGGTAAGPEPLIALHQSIRDLFRNRAGETLTATDVADIGNLIGKCVVAGNVRRSAEILLGPNTEDFRNLKNAEVNPERNHPSDGWGHLSNNTVYAGIGTTDYNELIASNLHNGEPGVFWVELAQAYGRLGDEPDYKDHRATGTNPCGEQTLESFECCTLVETYPTNAEDIADYLRTLKFAYLYAKSVTLLPTHWAETNAIMQRNRRIGASMTGIAQFVDTHTMTELRTWQNQGYAAIQEWDRIYSEWLCVRESIKTTSVKPSGTVSLLAGVTPGVHWPTYSSYIRRMRIEADHPLVAACREAGYHVEPDVKDPTNTFIIEFPVRGLPGVRTEREVSVWEKAALAVLTQRYWADNQVSCTLSFRKDEAGDLANILHTHEGQLKSVSFMPIFDSAEDSSYAQLPYEAINTAEYDRLVSGIQPVDLSPVYAYGVEAKGEKYCNNDVCEVPQ